MSASNEPGRRPGDSSAASSSSLTSSSSSPPAVTVGADFPGTAFVITSGLTVSDNVGALVFRLEEAAYLAEAGFDL